MTRDPKLAKALASIREEARRMDAVEAGEHARRCVDTQGIKDAALTAREALHAILRMGPAT